MAKLIINPTSSSRREIALARTIVSIGRDPSNDVVLPDAMVSRRHAVIEYRGSQYFLRDCNSSNGSLVNGDRVSERNLRDGDLVAIGTARLLFREELEEAGAKVVPHPSAPRQVCPSCQSDYRKGDMFCRQCGVSLAPSAPARVVCTSCGTAVLMPARFCNACGHPLAEAAAAAASAPSVGPPGPDNPEATRPRPIDEKPPSTSAAPEGPASEPTPDGGASPSAPPAPPAEPGSGGSGSSSSEGPAARAPRAIPESGASRSSPLEEIARSGAAVARSAPAAAALAGPRPAPAIVRSRPERAEPERRPQPAAVRPASTAPGAAGFWARASAFFVDALLVAIGQSVLGGPVVYYWWEHWWAHPPATAADVTFWPILVSAILVPVVLALGAVYYVYYWGVQGATPGKRLLGLVVQGDDGTVPIGLSRAAIRVLGYLLSGLALGIGFLMIATSGAGLHDRLAGTRVVRRERG